LGIKYYFDAIICQYAHLIFIDSIANA